MGIGKKFRKQKSRENLNRILSHAESEKADIMHTELNDAARQKYADLLDNPKYRAQIHAFMLACQQWRQYNPDVVLEWHDTSGILVSGDPSVEHVRRYLAKNDAAANLIEYADTATGKVCSLMQVQMALVGLQWIQ